MNRYSRRMHVDLYPDPAVLLRSQSAAARSSLELVRPDTAPAYRRRMSRSTSSYDNYPRTDSVRQSLPIRTSHIDRYLNQGSDRTSSASSGSRYVAQTKTSRVNLYPDADITHHGTNFIHRSLGGGVHIDLHHSTPEVEVVQRSRVTPSYSRRVEKYLAPEPPRARATPGYSSPATSSYSHGYIPHIDLYPDAAVLMANTKRPAPVHFPHLDLYPLKGLTYGRKGKNFIDDDDAPQYPDKFQPNDVYLEKMEDILSAYPCVGVPTEPSLILPNVFLGTSANAENLKLLRKHHINYVLNCAGGHPMEFRRMREMYAPDNTGVMGYEEITVEDKEHADIRTQFARAHKFIDFARTHRGRVLIHCPGVSRSGAITISYLINNGQTLLQAVTSVKNQRRVALCNYGFMKQLVEYAREKGMLEWDIKPKATAKTAGLSNPFYKYRVNAASIQRITNRAY